MHEEPITSDLLQLVGMAALQQVVEQLALLAAAGTNGTGGVDAASATSAPRGPLDLMTSMFKMFFSASALRDWMVLLVIGSLFETVRRLLAVLWYSLINSFFITAVFEEDDVSFRTALVCDRSRFARVDLLSDRVDHALVIQAAFVECVVLSMISIVGTDR